MYVSLGLENWLTIFCRRICPTQRAVENKKLCTIFVLGKTIKHVGGGQKTAARGQKPVNVKPPALKKSPAVKPLKDEAPVTIEWDINESPGKVQQDRASATPALQALISKGVGADEQGGVQGTIAFCPVLNRPTFEM